MVLAVPMWGETVAPADSTVSVLLPNQQPSPLFPRIKPFCRARPQRPELSGVTLNFNYLPCSGAT
jgi:hypothetical protein